MSNQPRTRPSLLLRRRDLSDTSAWSEFVDLYAPLAHDFLRRRVLQDADAADVVQDVLRAVASSISGFRYDRGRGPFRGWLFRVVRSKLADFSHRCKRHVPLEAVRP